MGNNQFEVGTASGAARPAMYMRRGRRFLMIVKSAADVAKGIDLLC
jgi:hypothetical protein